jgi:predicted ATP-binding protein involved in virulence
MKKIRQISVTNLFGIFNHTILLNSVDRVTIIHSPNGFGKTAILRLINGLFSQRNRILRITPFNELQIHFEDGSRCHTEICVTVYV